MKHILKYTISCLCLVYCSVIGFCADTFPISKTLKEAPTGYIENLHKFLCKKVLSNGEIKELEKRNHFACAFVVKTDKGSRHVCYVNEIGTEPIMAEDNFFANLLDNEVAFDKGLKTKVGRMKIGEKDFKSREKEENNLKENNLSQKPQLENTYVKIEEQGKKRFYFKTNLDSLTFSNGTFISCNQVPIYCLQEENSNVDSLLKKTYEILRKDPSFQKNVHQIMFFDSMMLLQERSEPLYRKYNSDSELHALYILGHEENIGKIAGHFKKLLKENEQITSIQFHGCTTKDMCVFCYTNMNAMQFLANKGQKDGLLGSVIDRCKIMGIATDTCQSATFISSIEEFPETGNLLMADTVQGGVIIDQFTGGLRFYPLPNSFVYQFRFSDDEIKALKRADEAQLKKNAGICALDLKGNKEQK